MSRFKIFIYLMLLILIVFAMYSFFANKIDNNGKINKKDTNMYLDEDRLSKNSRTELLSKDNEKNPSQQMCEDKRAKDNFNIDQDLVSQSVAEKKIGGSDSMKDKNLRKITVIGDSITEYNFRAGKNWVNYLEEWEPWQIQNLGISGTGFVKSSPYIKRIDKIDPNAELIGVAISFNDLSSGVAIGDSSKLDDNSLATATYTFLNKLKDKFPDTKIIVYVQNVWANAHPGVRESDLFVKNTEDICKRLDIDCYMDMYYKDSNLKPWDEENCKKYFFSDNPSLEPFGVVDNVHPNSLGHEFIAKYLQEKFKENLN